MAALMASTCGSALLGTSRANAQDEAGDGQQFSFDMLTERMRDARDEPWVDPERIEGFLAELDYDDFQHIRFLRERTRWTGDDTAEAFQLNAFHPGWLFDTPVRIHEIVDGQARPMTFSSKDFEYLGFEDEVAEDLELPGVAGFRLLTHLNRADRMDELVAFLGASYFRALGRNNVYGLSARGLAVNTGLSDAEEFPRFSEFWIERPAPGASQVTVYAALESQSVTGAYRFVITPGVETLMSVTVRLFFRDTIGHLGLAPLTSMYLFGGADPGDFDDFRPAVQDSGALVMTTRSDETFYRPLTNPDSLASSYLGALNPMSFGLVQRDRDFDSYLDAQAHYERRPSVIVEPVGDWGRGSLRLIELPSDLEANDNIVAYWVPEAEADAGTDLEFAYRLRWGMTPEGDGSSQHARVLRTRVGKGGVSGVEEENDRRKFVVDFQGGLLSELSDDATIEPRVGVMRGEITETVLSRIDGTETWRLVIEARAEDGATAELTARLAIDGRTLTETWLYQWTQS